jgi:hypothetical protein
LGRLGGVACALAAATLLLASGAAADHSVIEWVSHGAPPGQPVGVGYPGQASPDGSSVAYLADGRLVPQDTDSAADVYKWTNGANELLSTGPAGGNAELDVHPYKLHASRDLSHVFFVTREGLVHEDTDRANDLYEHAGGVTRLLTNGGVPFEGSSAFSTTPQVHYVTPNGSHVFFTTKDPLVPEDTAEDTALIEDAYVYSQGVTRLITAYPDGGNALGTFGGASADGSRAWFNSFQQLVPEDQNDRGDVYEHSGGTTTLVSGGIAGGAGFAGASADGSRIFITTGERLTPNDPDTGGDVYELTASGPVLITTGPADDASSASQRVFYVSPDGSRILFATAERLFSDLPRGDYLYERSGGTTNVISGPPVSGGAPVCDIGQPYENEYCSYLNEVAGDKVFHTTTGRLVPEDTDSNYDAYVYSGGANRLVAGTNAYFWGASSDGTRAFVTTDDALLPADTDALSDVYENHDGTLSLVTYYPGADPWGTSARVPSVPAVSDDGDVFFTTEAAVAGAPGGSTNLFVARVADQTGYPRPQSATSQRVSLVPAYRRCTSANRTHGPPLASPSCAPPATRSSQLTVGTPEANGQPPNAVGYVRVQTLMGDPATPADEADIRLRVFDQDVRRASNLTDYPGELQARLGLRITDRDGPTPAGGSPAPVTQQDINLSFTVPCIPTPDPSVGATCSTSTTADSLAPGVVVERRRAVWQLNNVKVLDGGPDGDAETPSGSQVFQVPGVFIP